jgi:hypothetical protein
MTSRRAPKCAHAEQAVGWALHALEPAEEVALLEHLPHCAQCRELVDETKSSLALLGGISPAVDPPPPLKARLMARIAETPQLRPPEKADRDADQPTGPARPPAEPQPGAAEHGPTEPPTGPVIEPEPPTTPVKPPPVPRPAGADHGGRARPPSVPPQRGGPGRRRPRRGQLALIAAALVAVVAIGGLAVRNGQLEQQRDAETAQAAQLARVLRATETPGVQHALLTTPDGQTMAAVLLHNGQRDLITVALPPNPSDQSYVLWGIDNGTPRAIGAFDVGAADAGLHNVGEPPQGEDYTGYAISLEPGDVPPATPSSVMASGTVST